MGLSSLLSKLPILFALFASTALAQPVLIEPKPTATPAPKPTATPTPEGVGLLIYAGPHWMDTATPEQLAKVSKEELDARYRPGDVVAVYPLDRCGAAPSPKSKFKLIKIPDGRVAEYKHLEDSATTGTAENTVMLRRRAKTVTLGALDAAALLSLDKTKTATVSKSVIDPKIVEKNLDVAP